MSALPLDELEARLRAVNVSVRSDLLARLEGPELERATELLLELEDQAGGDAPELVFSWDERAAELPKVGRPGIEVLRVQAKAGEVTVPDGDPAPLEVWAPVDVVVYRNRRGGVVGILYHYPETITVGGMTLETAGNVNLIVHPRRRGRGIGRALLEVAERRFDLDYTRQRYTVAGRAFVTRLGKLPAG